MILPGGQIDVVFGVKNRGIRIIFRVEKIRILGGVSFIDTFHFYFFLIFS